MDFDSLVKLLEVGKSPALMLLCFIAWQTGRVIFKGLDRLESIDGQLREMNGKLPALVEHAGKVESKLDEIHDDITGLPLEMLRLRGVRD